MNRASTAANRTAGARTYHEGRDELNLADFPISVLQRQQPLDESGAKKDTAVYEASRYDRRTRQRLQQKVILETSSRHGLPTPADENVVLALLYVAKHSHNFASPQVHFAPRQLFEIMGWSPNSRSYDRLRDVLRRLKALVIRYENSWWDVAGRSYEAEVATGIISEYELGRQTGGRKKDGTPPPCWVCWTPHFQRSLSNGNLKKLDLERLFSLKLPTAQRMYRFLDKRFYPPQQPPDVDMDLFDFACGHIGLSRVENVAELKRRLQPAVEELEGVGFLAPLPAAERFYKVKAGVWRVRFRAGPDFVRRAEPVALTAVPPPVEPAVVEPEDVAEPTAEEQALAREFYRLWLPEAPPTPGAGDLRQARELRRRHGPEGANEVLAALVQVLRTEWPACKTFSGAAQKYLAEAERVRERDRRRREQAARAKQHEGASRQEAARHGVERRRLEERWQALPEERRGAIEAEVLREHPALAKYPALLRDLCLARLGER